MKNPVVKHVEKNSAGLGSYELYHFDIYLLGNEHPIAFDCPATEDVFAWAAVAVKATKYHMPCMKIEFKGKG